MKHYTITLRNLQRPELRPTVVLATGQLSVYWKIFRIGSAVVNCYERATGRKVHPISDEHYDGVWAWRDGENWIPLVGLEVDETPEEPDGETEGGAA